MGFTRFDRFILLLSLSLRPAHPVLLRHDADAGNMFAVGSEKRHGVRVFDRELQEERRRGERVDGACGNQAVRTVRARVGLEYTTLCVSWLLTCMWV